MKTAKTDRRRNTRFPLGLPVCVHLKGQVDPITVELMDLSRDGGRFRSATEMAQIDQNASVSFLLPDERRCVATGRVVRADVTGEFALRLDRMNQAFLRFVGQLSG